ncbi:MAG: hypothetical protein QXV73_03975 [Candidatus Micrarchaeia archaeon]
MKYKKKTKLFSVRNTMLSVVPKPIVDMLGLTKNDSFMWIYDGKEIKVEVIKDGKTN